MIISYVILHYQEKCVTEKCVESILRQNNKDYEIRIIIVDNASPNQSGYELKEQYVKNKNIEVLLNTENIGFAKGNNIGIRYAKSIGSSFVVVTNNDTVFEDELFSDKIVELYKEYHFGVLGPDIISFYDKIHQNPVKGFAITGKSVTKKLYKAKIVRFMIKIGLYPILKKMKKENAIYDNDYTKDIDIDSSYTYILHGSCIVFAKPYLERYDGFYEGTFMYYEEHILAYRCIQAKIKMYYSPSLKVYHYRNIATKSSNVDEMERELFFQNQTIHSLEAFKNLIKNGE